MLCFNDEVYPFMCADLHMGARLSALSAPNATNAGWLATARVALHDRATTAEFGPLNMLVP